MTIERVAFVSLGCPKNLVDSESMLGDLAEAGYTLVSDHDDAEAIVINTCGFLEASKEESLEVIHEAIDRKDAGTLKRVVVTGCLVQRHRARMLEWAPGIDAMVGVFDRDRIREAVSGTATEDAEIEAMPRYWIAANALGAAKARGVETTGLTVHGKDGKGIGYWEGDGTRLRLTPRHWTYLRVSEGCNQNCAFCTIPSIRGKMRSKPIDRLVSEAATLMAGGAFELNLIGQDTTNYGRDIDWDGGLVGMLEALDDVAAQHGGGWIRLMYAYPTNFSDEMIDAIASLPNIVPYVDMPLQHASDAMLTAMRRNVTAAEQSALVQRLRDRIDGLALRTTFITGFPGETQEDHEQLLEFIAETRFEAMGVFQYSHESGTVAGTLDTDPNLHVPDEVKQAREAELMLLQQDIAFSAAARAAEDGLELDVLIDGTAQTEDGRTDIHTGRTRGQAPEVDALVLVESAVALPPGTLVRCRMTASQGYDLVGCPASDLENRISLPVSG